MTDTSSSTVPDITLNNGKTIPQLGFGVFQVPPPDTKQATLDAFAAGYRHIDTAEMYQNEAGVGQAIKESGLDRADVYITSKLSNKAHGRDAALAAFDGTLAELDSDYVDLFLIHWPLPAVGLFVETWQALEEIYHSGRARSIGVSNFQPHHVRRLRQEATVVPAVNQVELHPYLTQTEVRAADADLEIATEAWSPIAQGKVLDDPTIVEIAGRAERSPAQVVLRWHIQRGDIIIPKSVTPARVRENFALFDFELSDADVTAISGLNKDERIGPNPDEMNWIPD